MTEVFMQNKRVQLEVLLIHDEIVTTSKAVVADLSADMGGFVSVLLASFFLKQVRILVSF